VADVGEDALDVGLVGHDGDVVVEGQDGDVVVHEEFFGLGEGVESFLGVEGVGGLGYEAVVVGVGEGGVVVAVAGDGEVEEGGGVGVVAEPGASGDGEALVFAVVGEGFCFFAAEGDGGVELLSPHFGDDLGGFFVFVACVVENFDGGQAFAVGVACVGEELAGAVGLVGGRGGAEVVGDALGWDEGVGDGGSDFGDFVDDGLFVDGEGEGESDASVGEGVRRAVGKCVFAVEVVEVGAKGGGDVDVGSLA